MTSDARPDLVEVPREAVRVLVESLEGAWWVQAAEALHQLRDALEAPPAPDPYPTFGS